MTKTTSVRIRDSFLMKVKQLKAEIFLETNQRRNISIQDLLCVIISNTDFVALKKELVESPLILISEE